MDFRAESQKGRLLRVYRQAGCSLTSADAAVQAGLFRPGVCYWKRVSELAKDGLLTATGSEHCDLTGATETTYRITSKGERAYAGMR